MLQFATSFHARVRGLKSPTGRDFNAADCAAARAAEKNLTESDESLIAAATWIAAQSAARRATLADEDFDRLSAKAAVTLAIATLNRVLSAFTDELGHAEGKGGADPGDAARPRHLFGPDIDANHGHQGGAEADRHLRRA